MPQAEYETSGPCSRTVTARSVAPRSRRAAEAADMPAASPPTTSRRAALMAPGCHPPDHLAGVGRAGGGARMIGSADRTASWLIVDGEPGRVPVSQDG